MTTAGANSALVLNYKTWQADFAADPSIVGSTVYVQMHPFVVAGHRPTKFLWRSSGSHPAGLLDASGKRARD